MPPLFLSGQWDRTGLRQEGAQLLEGERAHQGRHRQRAPSLRQLQPPGASGSGPGSGTLQDFVSRLLFCRLLLDRLSQQLESYSMTFSLCWCLVLTYFLYNVLPSKFRNKYWWPCLRLLLCNEVPQASRSPRELPLYSVPLEFLHASNGGYRN